MRAGQQAVRILTSLLLCTLTPQLLRAQLAFFEPETLSLTHSPNPTGATINSSAKALLFSSSTGRRLMSQAILGHGVGDLTTGTSIYVRRIVSETGDPSNQATMAGIPYHCYETNMAAHATGYNLHQIWAVGPVCADPYEPPPRPDVPKENCPLLLDLQQDGFHLSGPDPAVRVRLSNDTSSRFLREPLPLCLTSGNA